MPASGTASSLRFRWRGESHRHFRAAGGETVDTSDTDIGMMLVYGVPDVKR